MKRRERSNTHTQRERRRKRERQREAEQGKVKASGDINSVFLMSLHLLELTSIKCVTNESGKKKERCGKKRDEQGERERERRGGREKRASFAFMKIFRVAYF